VEGWISIILRASVLASSLKSMEAKMRKAHRIMELLMGAGFDMTTKELFKTTVDKILRKYHIKEQLSEEEFHELLKLILDRCAENDLKNTGIEYFDYDDLKYK